MGYRGKKVYGQGYNQNCVFCGGFATQTTKEGLLVCRNHNNSQLNEQKCACGKVLELKSGKYGAYFNCLVCGNVNVKKGLQDTAPTQTKEFTKKPYFQDKKKAFVKGRKEINITTNDIEYFS